MKLFRKIIALILILSLTLVGNQYDTNADTAQGFNVYYLSVGKADCILLQQGELYGLVDTGAKSNLSAVEDFLKRKGVKTLEFLIVTSLDADHCGNVFDLYVEFKAKSIVYRKLSDKAIKSLSGDYKGRYNNIVLTGGDNSNNNCYEAEY